MKKLHILIIALLCITLLATLYFGATPSGKATWNNWFFGVKKAYDSTNYATLKKVEDTARAMKSSYESDRLTYDQYKVSDSEEKQGWAEQAKMRANKTAATYNNYILENNFIWKDGVPEDIKHQLPYLEE